MPDARWVDNIRKIVMQAVDEAALCDIVKGTVISASPLAVQVDQKLILRTDQLTLARCVTDHEEPMAIPGVGTVSVLVRGALKTGKHVVMAQEKGGQHYVVLDRI